MFRVKMDANGQPMTDAAGNLMYEWVGQGPPPSGPVAVSPQAAPGGPPPPFAAPQQPPVAPQGGPVDINALNEQARVLGATQARNQALEAELQRRDQETAAAQERQRQEQLRAMPPDQQVNARLSEMEQLIARERAERAQADAQAAYQIRMTGLEAYRQRAMREVPPEVQAMIGGGSEEEIDYSIDQAKRAYDTIAFSVSSTVNAQWQAYYAAQAQAGQQQRPPIAAPPPNPAYANPQGAAPGGALPMPNNGVPPAQGEQPMSGDIRQFTSEAAVRSGRFGGELRERLHGIIRSGGNPYMANPGSAPRYGTQPQPGMNYVMGPGGVMQPQGFPMGPVMNQHMVQPGQAPPGYPPGAAPPPYYGTPQAPPGYGQPPSMGMFPQMPGAPPYQQPQGAPPGYGAPPPAPTFGPPPPTVYGAPPQGYGAPPSPARSAAEQAIARTHAGANPTVGANLGAPQALADAHAHAFNHGIASPQAAFQQRFTNTPPINANGGQG